MKGIFFLLLFYCCLSYTQNTYPKGCYMNINEIVNKLPSKKSSLIIEKRTNGEIKMNGGNDFKLISPDKSVSNKEIKKEILAYSNGDTLFVNGSKYKVQKWYAPVIKDGRYLVFIGGISQDKDLYNYQIQESKTSNFWGSFGGIGGGLQGAKLALLRFPYVIDTKEDKLSIMNENYVRKLLSKTNLRLLKKYDDEKKVLDSKIEFNEELLLLKYIDILNEYEE